jgi:drug/metabolite transporter (DMT)-like permease
MNKKSSYLLAFLAYFIWGMTFPFAKIVIPPLGSLSFVFYRSLMGVLFLFPIILINKKLSEFWNVFRANWWRFLLMALVPYGFSYVLQFHAIQFTTAINQSIIAQTSIIWVVIMNFVIFKQKPKLKFLFGVIIGIIGVIILITEKDFSLSSDTIKGDVLSIFAFISWASYSVFSKPLSEKNDPLFVITAIFMYGTVFLFPLALNDGGFQQIMDFSFFQWGIMLYLGFVCTGIAYYIHLKALSHPEISSNTVVYFGLLMPIVSTIFSLLTSEDEELTNRIFAGGLLILVSVAIVLYRPRKRKKREKNIDSDSIYEGEFEATISK